MAKKIAFLSILFVLTPFVLGIECTDSDGGINKYEKGRVEVPGIAYDDQCLGEYVLEYSCEGNESKKTEIKCNCAYGVCWDSSICDDSENPSTTPGWYQDKYVKGVIKITYKNPVGTKEETLIDECVEDDNLVDYSCSPSDETKTFFGIGFGSYIKCEYGCEDGACIKEEPTCTDSDGGKNYYVKGRTGKDQNYYNDDRCRSDTYLDEFYCNEAGGSSSEVFKCPNGCGDGACIQEVSERKLIVYHKFNGNVNDYSGYNNYGTTYGNPQFISGIEGSALNFDGNDCVYLRESSGTASPLNIYNKDLTISAWVKWTGYGNTIVARAKPHYVTYWLRAERSKACARVYDTPTATHKELCTDNNLQENTLYHIAGVFDRANNQARVYVNGVLKASDYLQDAPPGDDGTTKIGCRNYYGDMPFTGMIDEVKIWNYALSSQEIYNEFSRFQSNYRQKCMDSDGGRNYYVKGYVTYEGYELNNELIKEYDKCSKDIATGEDVLQEKYCTADGGVGSIDYKCPYGCQDGACVKQTRECKPTYYKCPDGTSVSWCSCDQYGNSICIISPQNQCKMCGDGKCTAQEVNTCKEDCGMLGRYLILKDIGNYRFSYAKYEKQQNQYGELIMYGADYSFNNQNTQVAVIEFESEETASSMLKEELLKMKHSTTNIAGNIVYLVDNERTAVWISGRYVVGVQLTGYIKTTAIKPTEVSVEVPIITGGAVIGKALEPSYTQLSSSQTAMLQEIKTQLVVEQPEIEVTETTLRRLPTNLIIAYLDLYPSDFIRKAICGDGVCEDNEQNTCPQDCEIQPECPITPIPEPDAKENCLANNGEWVTGEVDAIGCPIPPYCKKGGEITEIEKLAIIMKLEKIKTRITDLRNTANGLALYYKQQDNENLAEVWSRAAKEFDILIEDINDAEAKVKDLEGSKIKSFMKNVVIEIKERLRDIVDIIISGISQPTVTLDTEEEVV